MGIKTPVRPAKKSVSALKAISSFNSLEKSWKRLYSKASSRSKDTSGVDGQSLNNFAVNSTSYLLGLRRELQKGTYQFYPLRAVFIPKKNGKNRVICIGTTSDRIVQGALLAFLSQKYNKRFSNAISHGFLLERGVESAATEAVKKRQQRPWVFKTDIISFFDNIPRTILKDLVRKNIKDRSLHPLLFNVIDSEIEAISRGDKKKLRQQSITEGIGIRQGMALSPFLSNVLLENFDQAILQRGFDAVRYADDLIFFASSEEECKQIEVFVQTKLREVLLAIPGLEEVGSKSEIIPPQKTAEFLGVGICKRGTRYELNIMQDQLDSIVGSFEQLGSAKELLTRKINLAKLHGYLRSRKSGYSHAYRFCTNIAALEAKLDRAEQDLLRKIYEDELLIPIGKLSTHAYTFLGLSK